MLIAGFVVFAVGLMIVICYPINKRKNSRCSEQTEGELIEIRRRYNSKGALKSAHVYAFEVDGSPYQLVSLDHSLDVHRIGDHCTIWYNPKKPQDAQAFRGSDKYLKTLLLVGVGLVVLGIVLTVVGLVLSVAP